MTYLGVLKELSHGRKTVVRGPTREKLELGSGSRHIMFTAAKILTQTQKGDDMEP